MSLTRSPRRLIEQPSSSMSQFVLPALALGADAQHVQPHGERRQVVAQVVREHGDQLLGARAPALPGGIARAIPVPFAESPFRSAAYVALAPVEKNMFNENVRARC
jgi:hypothetical protein